MFSGPNLGLADVTALTALSGPLPDGGEKAGSWKRASRAAGKDGFFGQGPGE